ncbi:hypothetical protein BSLG_004856 [Batrachochytrium salamandrivorans]|nr:hypothetical protein BSLG_004856 [Batrachochytrium salamandrivorans]
MTNETTMQDQTTASSASNQTTTSSASNQTNKLNCLLNGRTKVATLVLDSGPLIKGHQLVHLANSFVTIAEVLAEIKDKKTRERVDNLPFELVVRTPSAEAMAAVIAFAKQTGDYSVMSATDIKIIALAWTMEKEANGNAHLRDAPLRPSVSNGAAASNSKKAAHPKVAASEVEVKNADSVNNSTTSESLSDNVIHHSETPNDIQVAVDSPDVGSAQVTVPLSTSPLLEEMNSLSLGTLSSTRSTSALVEQEPSSSSNDVEEEWTRLISPAKESQTHSRAETVEEEMGDEEGWITPRNIAKHKARNLYEPASAGKSKKALSVACMTTDFAMQNVLMQMHLNILSVDGVVIRKLKNWVMRCHACYKVTKDMSKQFCPSCGNSTLIRTSVGVDANGQVTYYLKKDFQYNLRGTKYSIPKPKTGRNAGNLILCEDQREHQHALQQKQRRDKQLLSLDSMALDSTILGGAGSSHTRGGPSLLTSSGMPLIGHGRRNVNISRGGRRK